MTIMTTMRFFRHAGWKVGLVLLCLLGLYVCYDFLFSPTRIALVNFPAYQISNLALATDSRLLHVDEVSADQASSLTDYDAILLFGPGLRLTDEQRHHIRRAGERGKMVYTFGFSSNQVENHQVDSLQDKLLYTYYNNRCKSNYRSLLHYVHNEFDRHKLLKAAVQAPKEIPANLFFYLDEELFFQTAGELTDYLRKEGIYQEDAPRIAFLTGMNAPLEGNRSHIDSLIVHLTQAGFNVYPFCASSHRLEMLKSVHPDAIVYLSMGRLGDEAVQWMTEQNIPLFCPLPLMLSHDEWLDDSHAKQVTGGYLSARIVLPEVDGSIDPLVISTQNQHENGYVVFDSEPERLQTFVHNVKKYMHLRKIPQAEKRIAICFFKGTGQSALKAASLEVTASLYELLKRLRQEGYQVTGLPDNFEAFNQMLLQQAPILGPYAKGAEAEFLATDYPQWISRRDYEQWAREVMEPDKYQEVVDKYGEAPGEFMNGMHNGEPSIAFACLRFGNVVLIPQPHVAVGDNDFMLVHGASVAPPHAYLAPYLWIQKGFRADVLLHFGTHGSLEFTPGRPVALSKRDWADCLIGDLPHFYYYTIGNVGEGIIAKRRLHAALISYLTPPFLESRTRGQFTGLMQQIDRWHQAETPQQPAIARQIKQQMLKLGLQRDLQLDSIPEHPLTETDIERIENYAEEIANEKMPGKFYTLGIPFTPQETEETVIAMTADPIAYSLARLDRLRQRITQEQWESTAFISRHYLSPVKEQVHRLLTSSSPNDLSQWLLQMAALSRSDLEQAHGKVSADRKEFALAVVEAEQALQHVMTYRDLLHQSPEKEMQSLLHAFNGGYIPPTPGGDVIVSPNTLPTGRNMYSINAEATPGSRAWDNARTLVDNLLQQYVAQHGSYPRKVSYTLWAGEFIVTEGTTLAQALCMLGVEPVRDRMGRVTDLRLIPSNELGRPRIDVVVQTSGQLRDLAPSRLALITKAVQMASQSTGDEWGNYVAEGTVETEKQLVETGVSPQKARQFATARVFGGVNGHYGTGIMDLVEKGDAWEEEQQIANTYLNNMNAVYGDSANWGTVVKDLFKVALQHTDVVVQPRQSNTWGALSLDHVYEFMGGTTLTVRNITGKEPDAFMADYRNRNKVRMQNLKEAIGVESRTTLLNPAYIREKMKGGAGSANTFAKTIRNTYGWNVMRPSAIDQELWDELHNMYVKDVLQLGVHRFFKAENPAALQEITAVMLETARKGYWKASEQQLQELTDLHLALIEEFRPACSEFVCDNAKLEAFIAEHAAGTASDTYRQQIRQVKEQAVQTDQAVVLKQERFDLPTLPEGKTQNSLWIAVSVLLLFALLLWTVKRRNR
ncbi:MAG: cobaltochelatase subunit CobN [Parabacteroides sp.]